MQCDIGEVFAGALVKWLSNGTYCACNGKLNRYKTSTLQVLEYRISLLFIVTVQNAVANQSHTTQSWQQAREQSAKWLILNLSFPATRSPSPCLAKPAAMVSSLLWAEWTSPGCDTLGYDI